MTRLRGYANVFNEVSAPIGVSTEFRAKILPGAFKLLTWPIAMTVMHSSSVQIASTFDQSLKLWQDAVGLAFEAAIPETPLGSGLMSMVASGACGMSIGLEIKDSARVSGDDMPLHIVSRAEIDHITVCDIGAFKSARCWLNSMPVEQMQPDLAAVARRWRIGRAAHEQQQRCKRQPAARAAATPTVFAKSSVREEYESFFARHDLSNYSPAQWQNLLRVTELNSRARVRAGRR